MVGCLCLTLYYLFGLNGFSQRDFMVKKKKKTTVKKANKAKKVAKDSTREKVVGEPNPVRPVNEYYDLKTGEIYPKIFFHESWWTKFKRFLGLIP